MVAPTVLVGARILLTRTHTVNQPKVSPMRFQKRGKAPKVPSNRAFPVRRVASGDALVLGVKYRDDTTRECH